jgi:hypothetical protein
VRKGGEYGVMVPGRECFGRKAKSRIGLYAGISEYPSGACCEGDNPGVQTISREAVSGPSETIRPTPGRQETLDRATPE